jgi:hypothetical protein
LTLPSPQKWILSCNRLKLARKEINRPTPAPEPIRLTLFFEQPFTGALKSSEHLGVDHCDTDRGANTKATTGADERQGFFEGTRRD